MGKDNVCECVDISTVWDIEIDLLIKLMDFCKENQIVFFVDGGTLLGTVRHAGFIPWDDDIDIMMERKDFEKFKSIAKDAFRFPYFLQDDESEPGVNIGVVKLRNSKTAALLPSEIRGSVKYNCGIFLDIFPYDSLPPQGFGRKIFLMKVKMLKQLISLGNDAFILKVNRSLGWKGILKNFVAFLDGMFKFGHTVQSILYKRMERLCQSYNNVYSDELSAINFRYNASIVRRDEIQQQIWMPFENIKVPVPNGYLSILERNYGDWRKPVMHTSLHEGVLFDVSRSYKEVLRELGEK